MRIFVWVLRFVVFGVLVAFAAQNHAPVTVEWFGWQWQAPLAVVLLATALVGILLGLSFTFGTLVRQKWTLSRLRRRLEVAERTTDAPDRMPPPAA
ncbi:MAG: LapA family protein [Rhodocyclales bacterium]|nr:LapA family protein [Rhodocyclales bacterium]